MPHYEKYTTTVIGAHSIPYERAASLAEVSLKCLILRIMSADKVEIAEALNSRSLVQL
jgi:hypothetical protein